MIVKLNKQKTFFLLPNDYYSNIYNVLAALAVMNIYTNIFKLNKNTFLEF